MLGCIMEKVLNRRLSADVDKELQDALAAFAQASEARIATRIKKRMANQMRAKPSGAEIKEFATSVIKAAR
jgi:hypothetical protein